MTKKHDDEFCLEAEIYPYQWHEIRAELAPESKESQKPKVKGTIYWDHSKKGVNRFESPKYHNAYRATVTYNGKIYRKRSIDRHDCELFLIEMARRYEAGEL